MLYRGHFEASKCDPEGTNGYGTVPQQQSIVGSSLT